MVLSTRSFRILAVGLTTFALLFFASGCTSSRTAQEVAKNREAVLGTWEYRTDNISSLDRGTFQVIVEDGQLRGRFRDKWRGNLEAQVNIHGTHMELALDRVRISGRLEENRFRASVRSGFWDVSTNGNRRSKGYFVAQRVQNGAVLDDVNNFGCPSLLREESYACSPFGSE